jgi:small subunit ribosomal protein S1
MKTAVILSSLPSALAFLPASRWIPVRDVAVSARQSNAMSKFDRLKSNFKGEVMTVTPEEAGFGYSDFNTFLDKQVYSFGRGDIVKGTVVQFEYQGALVDIGSKSAAFMPLKECSLLGVESVGDAVDIDEERDFQIISDEDENGQLMLSIKRLEYGKAWEAVAKMQTEDKAFDGVVTAVNRGGCIVIVNGLRAFLPGSHLCGFLPTEDIVGKSFRLKLLEVNQENQKIVVSNRRAVVEDSMTEVARGDVVTGIVKAIKPYGAFVEINGVSGLLHISQISYDRIDDLNTVLTANSVIKCMIIDHDKVNGRIALSTKTLEPEPGDMIKNPKMVFEMAEQTAAKYHERMEAERRAREEAAKDIVMGLGDLDASFGAASDLEQILNPK